MRIIRYQYNNQPPNYGWVLDDSGILTVGPIEGSPFGEFRRLDADISLESVKLLPPVSPKKIVCVGRNYAAHAKEQNAEVPEIPLIFLKPNTVVIGPGETIYLPPQSERVEHEAELVAVIGKRGRWINPESATEHILGYTIGNDVTARDLQRKDKQWTRGKGFDTFGPIGPWVQTDFDPADAMVTCHVNGEMRQMGSTRDMIFNVRQLIAFISTIMTLEPGDLIFTGTPAGVSPISSGDTVEITIEGLGELQNPVMAETNH
jgi:2-keto-4-pentenoate hydratase/2-oxohepta-3-ene-1,7-dioic acid hydratase in catechol pathway